MPRSAVRCASIAMAGRCAFERVARFATRARRTIPDPARVSVPSAAVFGRGDFSSRVGDASRSNSNATATSHRASAHIERAKNQRGFAAAFERVGRTTDPRSSRAFATKRAIDDERDGEDDDDSDFDSEGSSSSSLAVGALPKRETLSEDQGTMRDFENVPVYSMSGDPTGEFVTLPGRIFDVPLRVDVAHRVVVWQRNRKRRGLHKAKTRAEVKGTTRKARPQKGGGRARVGDLRAPQMRGGGKAHGPVVRSHETGLQRKVRRLGLKVALSAKAAEGRVLIIDNAHEDVAEPKTKWFDEALDRVLGAGALAAGERQHSVLLAEIPPSEHTPGVLIGKRRDPRGGDWVACLESRGKRASKNLPHAHVMNQKGLNVYDILRYRSLVLTKDALEELVKRIDAPIKR